VTETLNLLDSDFGRIIVGIKREIEAFFFITKQF